MTARTCVDWELETYNVLAFRLSCSDFLCKLSIHGMLRYVMLRYGTVCYQVLWWCCERMRRCAVLWYAVWCGDVQRCAVLRRCYALWYAMMLIGTLWHALVAGDGDLLRLLLLLVMLRPPRLCFLACLATSRRLRRFEAMQVAHRALELLLGPSECRRGT